MTGDAIEAGLHHAWHAMEADAVLRALDATPDGLGDDEAARRLDRYGPNRLPEAKRRGVLARFAAQFNNLLIYVLFASAALSVALGHPIDAAVILAVVIVNGVVGAVQEGRAERALDAIRGLIDPTASVIRDGRRATVPASALVPGDIVVIEAGDRVPADLRLLRARGLRIDESALTGESVPVDKAPAAVDEGAALGDRTPMAHGGTAAVAGQGMGVAVATGRHTELGRIGALIGAVETLKTPLIRKMDRFAARLTAIILATAVLVFLFAVLARGYAPAEAFMTVVGLTVSAIPEGLPAIMSITLAIGVRRMAARRAIIRRLPAVETLGAVTVICADKTGTLTRNEMAVQMLLTAEGEVTAAEIGAERGEVLAALVRAGMLCNDAELRVVEGVERVEGDPMEGALVALGRDLGFDRADLTRAAARLDAIPFDAAHRFMATLHATADGGRQILIKGAPERVIDLCDTVRAGGSRALDRAAWHARAAALARRGLRVIALAEKTATGAPDRLAFKDVEHGATLLGLVGLMDPPRGEAGNAIAECRAAGIRVVMITGDHAETAGAIARRLGLADDPHVLTGHDVDRLDDDGLRTALRDTTVFARAAPEHKLRLVNALQADGHVVAMTGDGVNDAPALKRADVGVAMGRKGTEAAKETAAMVLTDDNFASIVAAVREGRTVYDNLVKVIALTLPTNGGETLIILVALALGLALPITPLQILWINMITTVALDLTLAFEPTEPGTMARPPRPPARPLLTAEIAWRVAFVSVLFVAFAFGAFAWAGARGLPIEAARTLVVNVIVVLEIAYLFSVRYVHGSALTARGVAGTPAVLVGIGLVVAAQAAFTYLPPMQALFETRPLGLAEGAAAVGCGVTLLLVVEAEKWARRRWR